MATYSLETFCLVTFKTATYRLATYRLATYHPGATFCVDLVNFFPVLVSWTKKNLATLLFKQWKSLLENELFILKQIDFSGVFAKSI
jgi:hypothetical protein